MKLLFVKALKYVEIPFMKVKSQESVLLLILNAYLNPNSKLYFIPFFTFIVVSANVSFEVKIDASGA